MSKSNIPIACDLSALTDREAHQAISTKLMTEAVSVTSLVNGYEVTFPVATLPLAAQFVDGERRCCPFIDFTLLVAPGATQLQLQVSGADGVKAFLTAELLPLLPVSLTEKPTSHA